MPKSELHDLPVIEALDSEEITVSVKSDDQKRDVSGREKLPHVKNVDLIAETNSNAEAPGFGVRHSLGLTLGLLLLILITYLVFG
jgi:hypothetical protein